MTSILFACELGQGLGHLNRLVEVARHLIGHDLTFALRDGLQRRSLRAALGGSMRTVLSPSPDSSTAADTSAPQMRDATLADTLQRAGFDDRTAVATLVTGWTALAKEIRPRVIVSDYAPMLRVAMAGRVSQVVLGSGFTIPPRASPLPNYEDTSPPSERSLAAEAAMLSCWNAVRADRHLPPLVCLADALWGDATFVASYPFLDPYRARREAPQLQPFNLPSIAAGPSIPDRDGPDVFAYLDGSYSGVNVVLAALNRMGRRTEVFVRHADLADLVRACAPHIGVHGAPADLARILPQTKLLVHHGGLATISAGLLAGVPQLLLPRHTEHYLNARGLATLGTAVGIALGAHAGSADLMQVIGHLLDDRERNEKAGAVSVELQSTRIATPVRPAVETVAAMMAAGPDPWAGAGV